MTAVDGSRLRRGVRLSTVLAVLLVLVSAAAGAVGAAGWRHSVREQADHEFRRQADEVGTQVRAHLAALGPLFDVSGKAVRAGQPLRPLLARQDLLRQYPGIVAVGDVTSPVAGAVRVQQQFSAVDALGVDLRLESVVGTPMRDAMAAAAASGRRTASAPIPFHWLGSTSTSIILLVQPVSVGGQQHWLVGMMFGNWVLQDSLEVAGSSFRAELVDGDVLAAGDYLPIGAKATAPPPPIPATAKRERSPITDLGRPWTLVVADANGVTNARIGNQPTLLLLGVSLLGLLSGLLVWVLGRSRGRALQMVEEATAELRDSELRVRRSEERFRSIVQYASDAILLVDAAGEVGYQSESSQRLFGYDVDALLGSSVLDLVHPEDRDHLAAALCAGRDERRMRLVRCRFRAADGSWRPTEAVLSNLLGDANVSAIVVTIRDVSDRHALEEQLRHQAFHDSLTGLANRALFADRVEHSLAQRARDGGVALLLCDLDDFKTVNDSLGHAAGDSLLTQIAERLAGSVRAGDTVARLGGDEFAVLLEAPAGEPEAHAAAERILATLRAPVQIEGRSVAVGFSIGIAVEPPEGIDGAALLRNADVAMYLAKAEGKGRSALFRPAMHAEVVARLAMRADLEGAVGRREFLLHYQPVFDLATHTVTSVEALLRWQHPKHGLVMPSEFIALSEESGHIVEIGREMLRDACRQVVSWQRQQPADQAPLRLNFNLSLRQLDDLGFVDDVAAALTDSGLRPDCLTLEITESMLMRNLEVVLDQLLRLKELGISLAVDDFGTGYSSLGYLQHLPVDVVKIDRSFVQALEDPAGDPALIRAVVDLATSLGLDTVAEGIEGGRQLELLRSLACREGQGYHFARPLAAHAVPELLQRPFVPEQARREPLSTR